MCTECYTKSMSKKSEECCKHVRRDSSFEEGGDRLRQGSDVWQRNLLGASKSNYKLMISTVRFQNPPRRLFVFNCDDSELLTSRSTINSVHCCSKSLGNGNAARAQNGESRSPGMINDRKVDYNIVLTRLIIYHRTQPSSMTNRTTKKKRIPLEKAAKPFSSTRNSSVWENFIIKTSWYHRQASSLKNTSFLPAPAQDQDSHLMMEFCFLSRFGEPFCRASRGFEEALKMW